MSSKEILLALSGMLLLSACGGGGGDSSPSPSPSPGPPLADTTPPDTSLTATPAALVNSTSANFTASATEAGSVFEASLDNGAYAAVTASFTLTVAEGAHTVNVRARDAAGNTDASPVTFSWTVDTTPPNTQITTRPDAITASTNATIVFTSEAGATFEVIWRTLGYTAATSPFQVTGLADGGHNFTVRARDAAGNVDPTPFYIEWLVDTVAPETTIFTSPPPRTNSGTASFQFMSEITSDYFVSLDGGSPVRSNVSFTTPALGDGAHTLTASAVDPAGNIDATPAIYTWTVDRQPPDTTITASPPASSNSSTASFSFSSEANVVFHASIDGGAYARVTSPLQLTGLATGAHSFSVRATDAAGNVETQPATFNWQVNSAQPTARILFPTPLSSTDATQLNVRGTANDPQGIASVSVNGVSATSTDAFANWSALVPIAEGDNTLTVSVTDNAGDTNSNAASVQVANHGVMHYSWRNTAWDFAGNRLFAFDSTLRAIVAVRGNDGYTAILSDENHGTGTALDSSSTIVLDAPNNRLIAVASTSLVQVDISTGNRTPLPSGTSTGDTSPFRPMVCNSPCTRLYGFTTGQPSPQSSVFSIDLLTGTRTVISGGSAGVGSGPAISDAVAIVLDTSVASPRLLVTERIQDAVIAVDIASGVRSLLAHASVGSGGALTNPDLMFIEPGANRLILVDNPQNSAARLLAVDLGTGNRSEFSVNGSPLIGAGLIALDAPNSRLLLSQSAYSISQLDMITGALTTFSDTSVGTGPRFSTGSLLLDGPPENRSLLLPATRSIVRADLVTGMRTTVLTAGYDVGPGPYQPHHMAFDTRPGALPNRIVFMDDARSSVIPMTIFVGDLATGTGYELARTTLFLNTSSTSEFPLDAANGRFIVNFPASQLSGVEVETGIVSTPFSSTGVLGAMALDAVPGASTRVLGVDAQSTMYASSLTGGAWTTVSSASVGTGPAPIRADGLSVDAPRRRALAVSGMHRALQWIDITNGNRTMVSGRNPSDASVRGGGPQILPSYCRVVGDFESGVAYVTSNNSYVLAVDLVSGDRVITAR